jgi:L-lysine 2,3-aminomutase
MIDLKNCRFCTVRESVIGETQTIDVSRSEIDAAAQYHCEGSGFEELAD